MATLFRLEALESRNQVWLGAINLLRPLSLTVLAWGAVSIAAAVLVFLAVGGYARKAHVIGYLAPDRGVIRLVPPASGIVAERRAIEGQSVHVGDVLFVLAIDRPTIDGDTQTVIRQSLVARQRSLQDASRDQAQLLAQQRSSIEQRIADMEREVKQLDEEIALHRSRLSFAQQTVARLQSLQEDGFVASAQVQEKAEEQLGQQAQLRALERQRSAQQREVSTLRSQLRVLPLQARARQGEIDRDVQALEQASAESEAQGRIVVRAPQDGVLSTVLVEPGQSVAAGVPMASLLPAGAQMQALLFAPSSAIGFVRPNQAVLLRYQAFPYQKFGHQVGTVMRVSRSPLQPSELATLPLASMSCSPTEREPLYRITVALARQTVRAYGQAQPLAPGMQVEADVVLDRRSLIEWIFEPVAGLRARAS
jgi:membrane fusion protein